MNRANNNIERSGANVKLASGETNGNATTASAFYVTVLPM